MKLILVAGPSQSGSTLLFNMIRLILEQAGHRVDSCWHTQHAAGKFDKEAEYVVVKCHFYDHDLASASSAVFLPVRDFRDSAVSCNRRYASLNTPEDYKAFVAQNIAQFGSWVRRATYVFKYERHAAHRQNSIAEVAARLGIFKVKIDAVLKDLDELHLGHGCPDTDLLSEEQRGALLEQEKYGRTLMTRSHNTSGGRVGAHATEIPKPTLLYIESDQAVRAFLIEHGYRLTRPR